MSKNNKLALTASNNNAQNQVQNFDISIFEIDKSKGLVNLTKIAKYFGKEIKVWNKRPSTQRFLEAFFTKNPRFQNLTTAIGGSGEQGTWASSKIALKFAEWISPEFEVWANEQLDTLLQTGKVELNKSDFPRDSIEATEILATKLLARCAEIRLKDKIIKEKDATVKAQQEVILSQNDTNVSLVSLKACEYKTVHNKLKSDIGKEINFYVMKLYLERAGNYQEAHKLARKEFNWDTGEEYLGAKLTSLETKKVYLKWLRGQVIANKNQLKLA